MKKLLVFLLAIFIAFSFVACDNNSALLPDSVFISAPENNSKNNPNFGGKTDQEKFKFCDDIYLEFLNSFLRNSSVIELINNASNNGYNLIPGTYSKENLTLIVYTERTYSLSFKKFFHLVQRSVQAEYHHMVIRLYERVTVDHKAFAVAYHTAYVDIFRQVHLHRKIQNTCIPHGHSCFRRLVSTP